MILYVLRYVIQCAGGKIETALYLTNYFYIEQVHNIFSAACTVTAAVVCNLVYIFHNKYYALNV